MAHAGRGGGARWATLLALPEGDRERRERPFWQALQRAEGWRRVLDAGCGGGFHLRLLHELGVSAVGLDAVLAPLALRRQRRAAVADLLAPPIRAGTCDAVLCLGNTFSLLPSRAAQRHALEQLASLVGAGGVVLLQGEDAAANTSEAPLARLRDLHNGRLHLRVFRRQGRRVQMLVGLVPTSGEAELEVATLLPTTGAGLGRMGRALGLETTALPVEPPGGPATWWVAFRTPAP
jgi:SAM-dependent methyltransferase